MAQDLSKYVPLGCGVVALGESDHREPAFGLARNELFARLAEQGFRSIALESGRIAGFAVDDHVRGGDGDFEAVMRDGFSHGFGDFEPNRLLVAWMREYNRDRPASERLAFHGVDGPFEFTAESPRRYLEHGRDYLGAELDIAALAGEDERWNSNEAVMDPAASPGDSDDARRLGAAADDLLGALYAEAPALIAATSRTDWDRARVHLTTALDLLRYHRQAARRIDPDTRWSGLSGVRDAIMARNLLDIREAEARRGPTLVFGHNIHLQRCRSRMSMAGMDLEWSGAGEILASLLGDGYAFVASRMGGAEAAAAGPVPWTLTGPGGDAGPAQGNPPLDPETLASADAVLTVRPS